MCYKKIIIFLIFILPIILISLAGCDSSEIDSTPTSLPTVTVTTSTSVPTPTPSATPTGTSPAPISTPTLTLTPSPTHAPIASRVIISRAPKLGETAELTSYLEIDSKTFNDSEDPKRELEGARIWTEFYWTDIHGSYSTAKQAVQVPESDALISGDLTWQGDATQIKDVTLHSTIQLPREGVWDIRVFFAGATVQPYGPFNHVKVAVTRDAAAIMGTLEFKSGPLAYLGGFPYGAAAGGEAVPNELRPVIMELDISKAPLMGEEAVVTCRIVSLHDVTDFSATIIFLKNGVQVPGENLMVQGSLGWTGDLKQGQPVEFSATITFHDEGSWEIIASGNSLDNEINHISGSGDILGMTIQNNLSFFGFMEHPTPTPTEPTRYPTPTATAVLQR
jgi:hypothetical protein